MHFEISLAMKPGKQLTATQKHHPYFSEAPKIGARVLRRGVPIKLSEKEFKLNEVALKRLFESESIEIVRVDNTGDRMNMRELDEVREKARADAKAGEEEMKKKYDADDPDHKHRDAEEKVTEVLRAEAPVDVLPLVDAPAAQPPADTKPAESQPIPESTPVPAAATAHDHKGKKGKR
jgi:hypothetical protein